MDIENEGTEVESQEDVESGSSPGEDTESSEGAETAGAAPAETKQDEPAPFHEHPRFKELVEQKNHAIAAQKELEVRFAKLQQQWDDSQKPKAPDEKAQLLDDLKKVDPRLAKMLEEISGSTQELQEFRDWRSKFEQQQTINQAVGKINQLHEANKLAPEMRQFVNSQLDLLYMQGKLNMGNLEASYKEVHEGFKKFEDSVRRAERESYVKDKSKDSKIPTSQPKGTPAKQTAKKQAFSSDKEVARQQIVDRFIKLKAAEKEASPV